MFFSFYASKSRTNLCALSASNFQGRFTNLCLVDSLILSNQSTNLSMLNTNHPMPQRTSVPRLIVRTICLSPLVFV